MSSTALFQAEYRLLTPLPDQLWVGDGLLLAVEITNRGVAPWLHTGAHPVRLSYHWRSPSGAVLVHDGLRGLLREALPPGASTVVELPVESPDAPGDYVLEIDLLEEGIAWFAARGVAPLRLTLRYTPPPTLRATIINGNVSANDAVGNHVVAELQALRAAGYQTIILTEHIDERLPHEVRRHITGLRLSDLTQPSPRVRRAVEHFRTSDVVFLTYSTYYELAHAIEQARGVTIFDYHGVTPPELWDPNAPGYADLVRGQRNIHLVRHADYAVAHSEYMRRELIATGLIAPERVVVAPLGPGLEPRTVGATTPQHAALRARYGLDGKRILLYVGRMARNKRVADLVEALALIRERHPQTVLLLVGDNQLEPYRAYVAEIEQRAAALGCRDAVIFTGQVPDVTPFYEIADVFVTASVHEGFCVPVIEAMARGKPVVAARATALPETVGDAGLLFEPRDTAQLAAQVTRLLDDLAAVPHEHQEPFPPRDKIIAFVTPRYGAEIIGGAERLMRGWAEHLAARGYRVEALTTCVADMAEWRDQVPPGVSELNGVVVRRFPIDPVDAGVFHQIWGKAQRGEPIRYRDERAFMEHNLRSSALSEHLRAHADSYACVIFAPYLFGTTYWAMRAVPDKAIIVPCLHDEPAARFAVVREMLEEAAGLFFNTDAECAFAVDRLRVVNPYRAVTGFGFAPPPPGDGAAFRKRYGLPERVLLYSGRLEYGKNVPLLLDYFVRFKEAHGGDLALALTGRGDVPLPARPDIIRLGQLPEEELAHAYAAALALCQPSRNESFSIVLMEAWLQGRPVLVHADCAVTSAHVQASGGGYTFADYPSFETALLRLLADAAHADDLGARGRAFVQRCYAWDTLAPAFLRQISRVTAPRSLYQRLAQRGIRRALDFTPARFQDALLELVEQARVLAGDWHPTQMQQLRQLAQVGAPGYTVRSQLPLIGGLIAWMRRQLTSHLREPYLDPIVERQEAFNRAVLDTLLPTLERSLREQRRLQREMELLRARLRQADAAPFTADPPARDPDVAA